MRYDIENQLAIIEQSIDWAKKYGKEDTFPIEQMKDIGGNSNAITQR